MVQQKQKRNDNRKVDYTEIVEEMYCMLQGVTWGGQGRVQKHRTYSKTFITGVFGI